MGRRAVGARMTSRTAVLLQQNAWRTLQAFCAELALAERNFYGEVGKGGQDI